MNQQLWRHPANIPDEFGRIWLVNLDKKPDGSGSWGITGIPMPVGWTDPLAMPGNYLDQPKGITGKADVNRLIVKPGLQKWLTTQRRYETEWNQRAFMVAQKLFGTAAHEMIQKQDDMLMREVGPKPFPSSQVIQAAINGHKGFLGLAPLTKEDRELLGTPSMEDMGFASEPAFAESNPSLPPVSQAPVADKPMPYFSFVKQMKEAGVTEKDEIKAHWEVYKAEFSKEAS